MVIAGLLWSPVAILVIILHKQFFKVSFRESSLILIPPLIFLFGIVISIWYLCKGLPFEKEFLSSFFLRHFFSLVLILGTWIGLTAFYFEILLNYIPSTNRNILYNESIPFMAGAGIFVYLFSTLIYYLIFANEKLKLSEKEALQKQLEASRSEIQALKTTIHPHFLFNTLNLLSPLIKQNPPLASELVSHLSEFLIYSFEHSIKQSSTLTDELDHIKNYLSVEKFRLGERLRVEFDIGEDTSELIVPPLILLPIVENSIKHGISRKLEGGKITIKTEKRGNSLVITIKNPFEDSGEIPVGRGYGLKNLKKRIELYYNGEGGILTEDNNDIYIVKIFIPLNEKVKNGKED